MKRNGITHGLLKMVLLLNHDRWIVIDEGEWYIKRFFLSLMEMVWDWLEVVDDLSNQDGLKDDDGGGAIVILYQLCR